MEQPRHKFIGASCDKLADAYWLRVWRRLPTLVWSQQDSEPEKKAGHSSACLKFLAGGGDACKNWMLSQWGCEAIATAVEPSKRDFKSIRDDLQLIQGNEDMAGVF